MIRPVNVMTRNLHLDRVKRPAALHGQRPQTESLTISRARGRDQVILASAEIQDRWANAEHHGGEEERQPESNISLSVHHGKLADQGTNVDHQVEVQIDTGDCCSRVNDHPFSIGHDLDIWLVLAVLLSNEWGNVRPAKQISLVADGSPPDDLLFSTYLKPPVPTPMMIRPIEKQAIEPPGLAMTLGMADTIRMTCPTRAQAMDAKMVRNRPQYWSATYAPANGMMYDQN